MEEALNETMGEMEPEKYHSPNQLSGRRSAQRIISHARRLELQDYARKIAAEVLEKTNHNERCLLRRMVEELLPGED